VVTKLPKASEVACKWAEKNGVTSDHAKSEAMLFSTERRVPTATVETAGREIPFNKEATRWLGIWLDVHLTLRDHLRAMLNKGRNAAPRLRWMEGQMGMTSGNYLKVMTACVEAVAKYGNELWWHRGGEKASRAWWENRQNYRHWSISRHGQSHADSE